MNLDNICPLLTFPRLKRIYAQFAKMKRDTLVDVLNEKGFNLVSTTITDTDLVYRRLPSLKSAYVQGKSAALAVFHNSNMCYVDIDTFSVSNGKHAFTSSVFNDGKCIISLKFKDSTELIYEITDKRVTKTVGTHSDMATSYPDAFRDKLFVKMLDRLASVGLGVTQITVPNMGNFHFCNDLNCPNRTSFDDAIYAFNNEMRIIIRYSSTINDISYEYISINICDFTAMFYNRNDDNTLVCGLFTDRVNTPSRIMELVEKRIIDDARSMVALESDHIMDVDEPVLTSKPNSSRISIPGMTPEEVLKSYDDYIGYETMRHSTHISCMLEGKYVPHLPIIIPSNNSASHYLLVFRDSKDNPTMAIPSIVSRGCIVLSNPVML